MLSIEQLLTEEHGRLTVRRVLSVDDGTAKAETTYETAGSFGDVPYTSRTAKPRRFGSPRRRSISARSSALSV